jgi:geranylgeranyl diphosphate synthase type II
MHTPPPSPFSAPAVSSNDSLDLDAVLEEAFLRHCHPENTLVPPALFESMSYSLLSPGKRIRPRLLLHCSTMLSVPQAAALPAALALEMFHCFTLIHDDLPCMDDDDFRRGQLSNHKKFGEGLALLAGDGLSSLAVRIFLEAATHGTSSSTFLRGLERFCDTTGPQGVIGGQAAEERLGARSVLEDLRQVHAQKTGALFVAALMIPADFAGFTPEQPEFQVLKRFADHLGSAFQMADDLEDLTPETPSLLHSTRPEALTSVLRFLTPEQVRAEIETTLTQSIQELESHWGERAAALQQIAREVIEKSQEGMSN